VGALYGRQALEARWLDLRELLSFTEGHLNLMAEPAEV